MKKFWTWDRISDEADPQEGPRVLTLSGPIDEDAFWGDEATPAAFRSDLFAGSGDVVVQINSPGGNVFAAAEIYNMLREYPGKVTVYIDALAASAASVVAMAGDEVLVSPVSLIMIHNPSTIAMGDANDMAKAIETLDAVKETIINSYVEKTGLDAATLAQMMDDECWMDAKEAIKLHFADGMIPRAVSQAALNPGTDEPGEPGKPGKQKDPDDPDEPDNPDDPDEPDNPKAPKKQPEKAGAKGYLFRSHACQVAAMTRIAERTPEPAKEPGKMVPEPKNPPARSGRTIDALKRRLDLMKQLL